MKNLLNLIKNQILIQLGMYLMLLAITYLFVGNDIPNIKYILNMLYWPEPSKFIYVVFSLIGFLFNIIAVYDDSEKELINCSCPYCEKEFLVNINQHDKNKDKLSSNNDLLYTGLIAGAVVAAVS